MFRAVSASVKVISLYSSYANKQTEEVLYCTKCRRIVALHNVLSVSTVFQS